MNIFGVITTYNGHCDVSRTFRGAQCYATRHGYDTITVRGSNHYYVTEYAKKVGKKWALSHCDGLAGAERERQHENS